jgi:glycosyltransferase involved in cell wall biosynthesis
MESMKPTGVLLLASSLRFGGAEKHTIALANHLDPKLFSVAVCHVKPNGQLAAELVPERREHVSSLGVQRKFEWQAVCRLADLLEQRDISVVACTNGYPLLYAMLAARRVRHAVRIVEVFHTTGAGTWKGSLMTLWNLLLFRRCDLLVYVSRGQRGYWRKRGMRARREVVIQNGIDADWFTDRYSAAQKATCRAQYGFGADDYVVGICAGFRPEKAHGDLLRAVQRLRDSQVNVRVLLIGDGPQRSEIEAQIADMGLTGTAAITGFQSDVRLHIASCDVMVLASHAVETFSIAALESMSLGKPLVLTRIGGAEEQVIDGSNGFLYEPGDIDALTLRLLRLTDADLRRSMGAQAAKVVREQFTTEKMTLAFEREFTRLAAMNQAAPPALLNLT